MKIYIPIRLLAQCVFLFALSNTLTVFAADKPEMPPKSSNVIFVGDINDGRIEPGQKIGRAVGAGEEQDAFLIYRHDGRLDFNVRQNGVNIRAWSSKSISVCPGYAKVDPIYGIALYDCLDRRYWSLYSRAQTHTNFHLAVENQSLRLYNLETSKTVWQVNSNCASSNCGEFVDVRLHHSKIEEILSSQGWSHVSVDEDDDGYDHGEFKELFNPGTHARAHSLFHSFLEKFKETSIRYSDLFDAVQNYYQDYKSFCEASNGGFCKDPIVSLIDSIGVFEEGIAAAEYLTSLRNFNEKIESGEIDPIDIFNNIMPHIVPDEQTDLKIYDAIAGLFLTSDTAGPGTGTPRSLQTAGSSGTSDLWWKGNVARGLGVAGGRVRFDLVPIESELSFGELAQSLRLENLSAPSIGLLNALEVRIFLSHPAYDPVSNKSQFQFRLRVGDFAGAKLGGPKGGILKRYKLVLDSGLFAGHEWIWRYSHDLDSGKTSYVKTDYSSSVAFLAEGTASLGELIRNLAGLPGASTSVLENSRDRDVRAPSDVSQTDFVENSDQNLESDEFQVTQEDLQALSSNYDSLSGESKKLVNLLMLNDSAVVPLGDEGIAGLRPKTVQISQVLDPDPFDARGGDFLYTSSAETNADVEVIDRGGRNGITDSESSVLVNAIENDLTVHQTIEGLLQTGSDRPASSRFNAASDPGEASSKFTQFLSSAGLILAGNGQIGGYCSLSTVYEFSEMTRKQKNILYISELVSAGLSGFAAGIIARRFIPDAHADITIGNFSAELGGFVAGDQLLGRNLNADLSFTGWDCGGWLAFKSTLLGLDRNSWDLIGKLDGDAKALGFSQNLRLQASLVFAGSMSSIDTPITSNVLRNSVPNVDHDWTDFSLPKENKNVARFEFMQTAVGADTANVRSRDIRDRFGKLLTHQVRIEEEQSRDHETVHYAKERVGIAALGEGDIVDVNGQIIGEAGLLGVNADSASDYRTLDFSRQYRDPVVVMAVNTFNGGQPVHMRLANLSSRSVEYSLEEWDVNDGVHAFEQVSYMVIESGSHLLANRSLVVAGRVDANTNAYQTINFDRFAGQSSFRSDALPIVLVQPHEGQRDRLPLVARVNDVKLSSFDLKLQREEAQQNIDGSEEVGFVAIGQYDSGQGVLGPINFNYHTFTTTRDSQDDPSTGDVEIDKDGADLRISGNRWQLIDFNYNVKPNTVLEFTLTVAKEGEIQGIGFGNANQVNSRNAFKLHGSQSWGIQDFTYTQRLGNRQTFKIPVGKYFTGKFEQMVFVHDDDSAPYGLSRFSNVRVYDE